MTNLFQNHMMRKIVVLLFLALQFSSSFMMGSMAQATSLPEGMTYAEFKAYQFPDGSLPVFCNVLDDESGSSFHVCDGCSCNFAGVLEHKKPEVVFFRQPVVDIFQDCQKDLSFSSTQKARSPPIF